MSCFCTDAMGRFQLELFYHYFPPSFHLTVVVSCPVGLSCPSQETEVTSTSTRPVKNVITKKKPTGHETTTVRWKDGGK